MAPPFQDPYELALMRPAQRLTVTGHRAAEAAFRESKSEFAILMARCSAVGRDSGELPHHKNPTLNKHAAVLHYTQLDRSTPDPSRRSLIDAGASFHGNASDITHSYAGRYLQRVPSFDRRAGRRADRHGPARAPGWTTANCV